MNRSPMETRQEEKEFLERKARTWDKIENGTNIAFLSASAGSILSATIATGYCLYNFFDGRTKNPYAHETQVAEYKMAKEDLEKLREIREELFPFDEVYQGNFNNSQINQELTDIFTTPALQKLDDLIESTKTTIEEIKGLNPDEIKSYESWEYEGYKFTDAMIKILYSLSCFAIGSGFLNIYALGKTIEYEREIKNLD